MIDEKIEKENEVPAVSDENNDSEVAVKKNHDKRNVVIKLLVFGVLVLIMLWVDGLILIPKWTGLNITKNQRGFYSEPKNSLDVLFVGSSNVSKGISPIELWSKTGIPSYNRSTQGQTMWTSYYILKDALNYQSPKVVVVNIDGCFISCNEKEGNQQKFFNNLSWGEAKWEALCAPAYKISVNDIISYMFPVFRYHSRFDRLVLTDLDKAYVPHYKSETKGYEVNLMVNPYKGGMKYMKDTGETKAIPKYSVEYLDKIVELCKDKNIKLILSEVPSSYAWSKAESDAITAYANGKGVTFIDFNTEEMMNTTGFDWKTDTIDRGDHCNISGAVKITDYFGDYFIQNFGLTSKKDNPEYASWKTYMEQYNKDIDAKRGKEVNKNKPGAKHKFVGKQMSKELSDSFKVS